MFYESVTAQFITTTAASNQSTIELVFVTSPLNTQHKRNKSKNWLARNHQDKCVQVERHVYLGTVVSLS